MEGLAGGVHRLTAMHRGDHGGAGQLTGHIAAPAGGSGVSVHQLDMVPLDEVDEVKHMPETAQYAALVEPQLEHRTQGGFGQGI
ncbi:hypothetical protein D3C75_1062170 [compost metagenome]